MTIRKLKPVAVDIGPLDAAIRLPMAGIDAGLLALVAKLKAEGKPTPTASYLLSVLPKVTDPALIEALDGDGE